MLCSAIRNALRYYFRRLTPAKCTKMLKGKTLGVQSSSTSSNFVDKYLKDVVEVREYKTVEQHNLDLKAGRVDLVIANVTVLDKAVTSDMKDATLVTV